MLRLRIEKLRILSLQFADQLRTKRLKAAVLKHKLTKIAEAVDVQCFDLCRPNKFEDLKEKTHFFYSQFF